MQKSFSELTHHHLATSTYANTQQSANITTETRACLILRSLHGVGDATVRSLINTHKSAERALDYVRTGNARTVTGTAIPASVPQASLDVAKQLMQQANDTGVRIICITQNEYPARLLELHDPPSVLFVRGTLETSTPPAVAVVGTRNASGYGLRVAKAIATVCARSGVSIVSGLARGIDGAAHEAALTANGRTVAVLGTGIDVTYPRSHRALQERIAQDGLLISELGFGDSGHAGTFPRRNRIIAALADITVVVEAGTGSGALITADHALELGRTVACVPNAIDVSSAKGSNALLKAHAEPLLSADDVLALLGSAPMPPQGPALDGATARCWDAVFTQGARSATKVAEIAEMSLREANAALSLLEIDGLICVEHNGQIVPSVFPS